MKNFKFILLSILFLNFGYCYSQHRIIDNDTVKTIVVKLNFRIMCPVRTIFDDIFADKTKQKDMAKLTYEDPDEIRYFCEILNSAKPCTRPYSKYFPSPDDIRQGKNYVVAINGSRMFIDPLYVRFKIEITTTNSRRVIWGGPLYFDTESERYIVPRKLFCESGKVRYDVTDWRQLWDCE